jgi:hypothetical protein
VTRRRNKDIAESASSASYLLNDLRVRQAGPTLARHCREEVIRHVTQVVWKSARMRHRQTDIPHTARHHRMARRTRTNKASEIWLPQPCHARRGMDLAKQRVRKLQGGRTKRRGERSGRMA